MSAFRRFIRIILPVMLVALWVPILAAPAQASPGDLDPTFGSGGTVSTPIGSSAGFGNGVVVQPDGKILVAGTSLGPTFSDFAVVRYTPSGGLDGSFGSGGKVTTSFGSVDDGAFAVALQTDGKIVVAGRSHNGSNYDFALARYTSAGALDLSFGSGGKVTTPIGSSNETAWGVTIQQSDGKIVAAGESLIGGDNDFALVRYTTSGVPDGTFGSAGKVTTHFGGVATDIANEVIVQSDGKIMVAGQSSVAGNFDFAFARYTGSGSPDPAFGTGGRTTVPFGSSTDVGEDVALQADGKIVAAGFSFNGSNTDFALVRLTPAGGLDTPFGVGGKVTTAIGSGADSARALVLQADGKIVLAGDSDNGLGVIRYTSGGALDPSFGVGGKVTTLIGSFSSGTGLDLQPDGKIVLVGYNGPDPVDFAVARYLAAPPVVSIGDAFVVEENAESVLMQFPVSLAEAGSSDYVAVDYQTVADTAGSKDFGATSGTVTFNPGQTTGTISVSVKGDSIYEESETFFVKLSSPVGATLGDSLGEGTIVDNDGVPDMSISSPSVTEGNSGTTAIVYTLSLTNPSSEYISVDFSTADGTATAPADYQSASGTRWFKPGQVTRTITVYVKGETVQELNETVLVNLSDANGAGIETGQGVGTIIDDDRPTISINDAQVTEGTSGTTKTMTFTVTLSKAGTSSITVQYATANGTAVAPGDYTAKSGTLTFSAGQVSKPVTVTIKGDNLAECTESFFVNLSNATNASIADGQGVGTIVTDEPNPCD
jgi:uncharacterized delta-60 repeat protein